MSWIDVSLETANRLYVWGWRGSIGGALITAIAVVLLMWGTRVRDKDFESKMGQAHERAAQLEKDAAQARLEQEKLRQSNVRLEASVEQERVARLQLQQQVAWRNLSVFQYDAIVKTLSRTPLRVDVVSISSDPESHAYARQIVQALRDAGCSVITAHGMFPEPIFGIQVSKTKRPEDERLRSAFHLAQIRFVSSLDNLADEVRIVVGSRSPIDPVK